MRRLIDPAKKATGTKPESKDNLWILQLLGNAGLAADLNYNADYLTNKALGVAWGKGLCVACKGGKFLC